MKPQSVIIKLRGHWFALPFVAAVNPREVSFGREEQAQRFTRAEAAALLLRLRSWGRYYRAEVAR